LIKYSIYISVEKAWGLGLGLGLMKTVRKLLANFKEGNLNFKNKFSFRVWIFGYTFSKLKLFLKRIAKS
jgi:hypothetical protein